MKLNDRLVELDESWRISLSDAQLSYIHVDFRLGLDVSDAAGTVKVIVEETCQLIKSDKQMTLTPGDAPSVAPILSLFNSKVESLVIQKTGTLTLTFSDEYRLQVDPTDKYEAWEIACEGEFLIVCAPGGTVTVFRTSHGKK